MTDDLGNKSADHLRSFIERVERLEEEKKSIADDIREVFSEAKSSGFDVKALRSVIKYRKQEPIKREEEEAILNTYLAALGHLVDTPLGDYAIGGLKT
jgi:uncharacterized protein (UPF0335 family)